MNLLGTIFSGGLKHIWNAIEYLQQQDSVCGINWNKLQCAWAHSHEGTCHPVGKCVFNSFWTTIQVRGINFGFSDRWVRTFYCLMTFYHYMYCNTNPDAYYNFLNIFMTKITNLECCAIFSAAKNAPKSQTTSKAAGHKLAKARICFVIFALFDRRPKAI